MILKINGTEKTLENHQNLNDLIKNFCHNSKHIIAEVNGDIIKSPSWKTTNLKDGDSIELVSFVGGG